MTYLADGRDSLVFASKTGADSNPDWHLNLRAEPDVSVEVRDEIVPAHAIELTGSERDAKDAIQAQRYPGFAGYQDKTSRIIPVVRLTRR